MTFDTRMQQTALKTINQRGKSITYSSVVAGAYDPATSGATATTNNYTPKAVVSNGNGSDLVNGALITRNDKSLTIAALALPIVPAPNDRLTLDGESYLVTSANAQYAGELPVIYLLRARKA